MTDTEAKKKWKLDKHVPALSHCKTIPECYSEWKQVKKESREPDNQVNCACTAKIYKNVFTLMNTITGHAIYVGCGCYKKFPFHKERQGNPIIQRALEMIPPSVEYGNITDIFAYSAEIQMKLAAELTSEIGTLRDPATLSLRRKSLQQLVEMFERNGKPAILWKSLIQKIDNRLNQLVEELAIIPRQKYDQYLLDHRSIEICDLRKVFVTHGLPTNRLTEIEESIDAKIEEIIAWRIKKRAEAKRAAEAEAARLEAEAAEEERIRVAQAAKEAERKREQEARWEAEREEAARKRAAAAEAERNAREERERERAAAEKAAEEAAAEEFRINSAKRAKLIDRRRKEIAAKMAAKISK